MLTHGCEEAKQGRITVKEMDVQILEQLLKFMYAGKIEPEFLNEHCEALYRAADQYDVDDLIRLCEEHLIETINVGNALVMYDLAGSRPGSALAKKSFELISKLV